MLLMLKNIVGESIKIKISSVCEKLIHIFVSSSDMNIADFI